MGASATLFLSLWGPIATKGDAQKAAFERGRNHTRLIGGAEAEALNLDARLLSESVEAQRVVDRFLARIVYFQ